MATVTYSWQTVVPSFFVDNLFTAGNQVSPAVSVLSGGRYFVAWFDLTTTQTEGRVIGPDGTPVGSEFVVNTTIANNQFDPSVAGLTNGNAVVTFTDKSVDAGGDVRARIFGPNGNAIALDFDATGGGSSRDFDSDVAALADGGFVVTWTRDFDGHDDLDVLYQLFDAAGQPRDTVRVVNSSSALATDQSQVAGLTTGG